MVITILALGLAILCVAIGLRWRSVATRKGADVGPPPVASPEPPARHAKQIKKLRTRVATLEADHTDLRAAVAHGIDDVTRINNRINASLRRYHEEREESGYSSPALDSELERIQPGDGVGGGDGGVSPMPPDVEVAQSSIPGVTAEELAMVRGRFNGA